MTDRQLELAWALYRRVRRGYVADGWFRDDVWAACVARAKEEVR